MTRLVREGPDFPDRLLQAHEDGGVVFFCGAGISYPAGLPGFGSLTEYLFQNLVGSGRTATEKDATDKKHFDTAIGLLEARLPKGREQVRGKLSERLVPNLRLEGALRTHEALLALGRVGDRLPRLVTTNFDRLFEIVGAHRGIAFATYEAPMLPLPKRKGFEGVVYLHGLLHEPSTFLDQDRLILSSADFGRAYLTERWASRFVSELFRNYTVCFVGYSIDDPVLRYMMDALAADRLGEALPPAYALAASQSNVAEETRTEWLAKGVEPILYTVPDGTDDHTSLHASLAEWAGMHRQGVLGKQAVVAQYAGTKPLSLAEDDFVAERMLWAVSDRSGLPAKAFADSEPAPAFEWIEVFSKDRYTLDDLPRFGLGSARGDKDDVKFSLLRRPFPFHDSPPMSLVNGDEGGRWDKVMFHLARWVGRLAGDSRLILWLAKRGRIDPRLARQIREHEPAAPDAIRSLWSVVLSGRIDSPSEQKSFRQWVKAVCERGLSPELRSALREVLRPTVFLREPLSWGLDAAEAPSPLRVRHLVDYDVRLASDDVWHEIEGLRKDVAWPSVAPQVVVDLTLCVRDTFDLLSDMQAASSEQDYSRVYRPSISDHSQNRTHHEWVAVVELLRDAWSETLLSQPRLAISIVEIWRSIPFPIFQRLSFWAASVSDLLPASEPVRWLLDDGRRWLWSHETHREVMRLLVSLAKRLSGDQAAEVQEAILEGPPRSMYRADLSDDDWTYFQDRNVWIRLAKLRSGGAQLSHKSVRRLEVVSARNQDFKEMEEEREEFLSWIGGVSMVHPDVQATPRSIDELEAWAESDQPSDWRQPSDWGARARTEFTEIGEILGRLAERGKWPRNPWQLALQAWAGDEFLAKSWAHVGPILIGAPADLLQAIRNPLTNWLEAVSKAAPLPEQRDFFALTSKVLEALKDVPASPETAFTDHVDHAINHPIGRLTQAILNWWFGLKPDERVARRGEMQASVSLLLDQDVQQFRHGRLLLCTHVYTLFRDDPEWTSAKVLPFFNWTGPEALGSWQGFLWVARYFDPLMTALKDSFLEAARHYKDFGDAGRRYAEFLMYVALESAPLFEDDELAKATRVLPTAGLEATADALARYLHSAGNKSGELWRGRVSKYMSTVFPPDFVSEQASRSLAWLCVASGDAFGLAFRQLQPRLRPVRFGLIHRLSETSICKAFPREALDFLDLTVDRDSTWGQDDLRECLNEIVTEMPELGESPRYRSLDVIARGNER